MLEDTNLLDGAHVWIKCLTELWAQQLQSVEAANFFFCSYFTSYILDLPILI